MKNTVKVAVTGGIGSGKSAVLAILDGLGYETISSDDIVKNLYQKNCFKRKIKKTFPFVCSGLIKIKVDKKALSSAVFSNRNLLEKLNEITHPLVYKRISAFYKRAKGRIAFAEVPLLFETQKQKDFDKVLIVMREDSARIKSVIERSAISEAEVLERIKDQINYSTLDKGEYIVINNDGDTENLKALVKDAVNNLII